MNILVLINIVPNLHASWISYLLAILFATIIFIINIFQTYISGSYRLAGKSKTSLSLS